MWVWNLVLPLYELYWLLTTRHLTANIFSCIPIFLDNDFCKTINLFIIDIYACSIYLEEKAPVKNKQTSINKNKHVNVECLLTFCSRFPLYDLIGGWELHGLKMLTARPTFSEGAALPTKCQMSS